MAKESLTQFSSFINQSLEDQEMLNQHLLKVDALLDVFLNSDFTQLPKDATYGCFWVLSDLIKEALRYNEEMILHKAQKAI